VRPHHVNGQCAYTTIRKSILPDQWDAIRGQASPRTTLGKAINLYIDTVRARIIRIHRDLEMDEQPFTAQQVLDLYLGRKTTNRHTLFELFREHNDKCHQLVGIDLAAATAERYETCMKLTQEFMRHTYHRDDLYLDEVDRRFVEEFEFYLKTHRGCCHNTATKYLKNFKKITRIALAREWMQRDPFAEIRFSLQPVKREMPEKAEIERLMHKEIDIPRLAQTRDLFIFSASRGSPSRTSNSSHPSTSSPTCRATAGFASRARRPATCATSRCWRSPRGFCSATARIPSVWRTTCCCPCRATRR